MYVCEPELKLISTQRLVCRVCCQPLPALYFGCGGTSAQKSAHAAPAGYESTERSRPADHSILHAYGDLRPSVVDPSDSGTDLAP
jgi:hypothetical protein